MRILHVGEYVSGGVATYIRTLLEFQSKNNDVYFILSRNRSENTWPIPNDHVFYYEYERTLRCIVKAVWDIYNFIKIIHPDIIHIHSTWAGVFVRSIYFFQRTRPKIVYCAHGWAFSMDVARSKKNIFALVERLLTFKTDKIINISKNEQKQAGQFGIPMSKCVMIYSGIKDACNCVSSNKAQLMVSQNKINLLYVGRFDRSKGVDILIDVFTKYRFSNTELYLIGDSVIDSKRIDIPEGIHYVGWVDNELIDQYYLLCDAVIMPSRWEGFGLVAIEAMRNKKAVIASNRGALSEIVRDGISGYIFDIDVPGQLVDILRKINKAELKNMGDLGFSIYKEKFTSQRMNKEIINEYKKCLL